MQTKPVSNFLALCKQSLYQPIYCTAKPALINLGTCHKTNQAKPETLYYTGAVRLRYKTS